MVGHGGVGRLSGPQPWPPVAGTHTHTHTQIKSRQVPESLDTAQGARYLTPDLGAV